MDRLWTAFLNSDWHDWRGRGPSEDRLGRPDWLARFLEQGRLSAPIPPNPEELADLVLARARLRSMAEVLAAGGSLPAADIDWLNERMAQGPVIRRAEKTEEGVGLVWAPLGEGWRQAVAEVCASLVHTLTEGESARVRICENRDCRWVFYDETRNRGKRFCDDKLCGNLIKVRRFRARHR